MSESVESEWWSQTKFPWFDLEKHKFLCYFGTPIYSLDTLWQVLKKKMFGQKGTWQFLNIFMLNTAFQGMLFLSPSIFRLNLNLQYLLIFNAFRQLVVRIPFLVCKLPVIQVLAMVGINSMAFPWGFFFQTKKKNPPKKPVSGQVQQSHVRQVGWLVVGMGGPLVNVDPSCYAPEVRPWKLEDTFPFGMIYIFRVYIKLQVGRYVWGWLFFWCWCLIVGWRSIIWGPM